MDVYEWARAWFDASPLGVAVFDESESYLYVNAALAAMNGLAVESHLGRHPVQLFGDGVREWFGRVRAVLATGEAVEPYELVTEAWGPRAALEVSFYPVTPPSGGRLAMVVARQTTEEYVERTWLQNLADGSPRLAAATSVTEVAAAVVDGAVVAALDVGIADGYRLSDGLVDAAVTLAAFIGAALTRVSRTASEQEARLAAAFDAMLENVTITEAVRDFDGAVVDFRIVYANAHAHDAAGRPLNRLLGGSILEQFPGPRASGLFDATSPSWRRGSRSWTRNCTTGT